MTSSVGKQYNGIETYEGEREYLYTPLKVQCGWEIVILTMADDRKGSEEKTVGNVKSI